MGRPLALDDLHSMERHNNQPTVGSSNELEVGAMASWEIWVVWDIIPSFELSN
jgi:hypothetical protein